MEPLIYIVDDDKSIIESLSWIIQSLGIVAKGYSSANAFLEAYDANQHGCVLLDVRMAKISGPELQSQLNAKNVKMPIIFISAYGDIALAVRVMKEGATDFITKPFNIQLLLESINRALSQDRIYRENLLKKAKIKKKMGYLSNREMQILQGIIACKANKTISSELHISLKTVEAHRSNIMKKMDVKSVSELIKLILTHEMQDFNKETA